MQALKGKCLEWQGYLDRDGYGGVKIAGKTLKAHRVAMEIHIGRKLEKNEIVMHLCNNPRCYSAKHLKIATTAENNAHKRESQVFMADKYLTGYKELYA